MAQEAVGSSPITHPIELSTLSGCGAVRLAHLLWEQGVGSSNLSTPTEDNPQLSTQSPSFRGALCFVLSIVSYRNIYHKGK